MARIFPKRERVYILPTSQGIVFLLFVVATILMGAIYSNQLVNLLGFLLLTIFALAMVATHQNLSKMKNLKLRFSSSFAGESAVFRLEYTNPMPEERVGLKLRCYLNKKWGPPYPIETLRGEAGARDVVLRPVFGERGVQKLTKFRLETEAPLGLFRAWRDETQELEIVTYPARHHLGAAETGVSESNSLAEEWDDPHPLEVNDWVRRMDWRRYARTDRPWIRPWIGSEDKDVVLRWEDFKHLPLESRLSHFTACLSLAQDDAKKIQLVGPWGQKQPRSSSEAAQIFEMFARWENT